MDWNFKQITIWWDCNWKRKTTWIFCNQNRPKIYCKYEAKETVSSSKTTQKNYWRQKGGFLKRHDFSYAGRDTVNQVRKISPLLKTLVQKLITLPSNELIKSKAREKKRLNVLLQKFFAGPLRTFTRCLLGCLENLETAATEDKKKILKERY